MSRASRARRIAAAAAFGGGGLTALGALGVGLVTAEAKLARRQIGTPFGAHGPDADGVYGSGPGDPIDLVVAGDSSAAGLGCESPRQTPGAILATGLAAVSGRPVRLTTVAVVGAQSSGLAAQLDEIFERVPEPDVAVIMVGANDVTHRVKPPVAVRALAAAVTRLREAGVEVVVGTCPDLGTVEPIPQPLRWLARRLSREMAAAQTIAVVEAGGRSVSLGNMLGPEFEAKPHLLFSEDRFHPSAAGYARCASALLPSVCAVAGYWPDGGAERAPERWRGEGVAPVARAAVAAADEPGTEVAATRVGGDERGRQGRWAVLLRRRRHPLPEVDQPSADGAGEPDSASLGEPSVRPDESDGLATSDGVTQQPAEGAGAAVSTVTDATPHTSATEK
ncbi:MAG TPA: SGNH/GDSL hydrolase family protein [Actinomycetales bacterium]|nr:SGNH/GDSL hydrolase family protein [Actinomycetales bacterium]